MNPSPTPTYSSEKRPANRPANNLANSPTKHAFEEYTVKVTFRLAVVFVINNGIAGLLGEAFSLLDPGIRLRNMLVISLLLLLFLGLLLFIQSRIHSTHMQNTLYFSFAFVSYILAHLINKDKGMLVAMAIVSLIMPFLLVLFQIRYAVVFSLLHMGGILAQWMLHPTPIVQFGPGVYLYLALSSLSSLYIVIEGIRLFRLYQEGLHSHIHDAETRNTELAALNEEYQASEETLQAQYDEILTLHLGSEDLNKKLQTILSHANEGVVDYNITSGQCLLSASAWNLLGMGDAEAFPMERGWKRIPGDQVPLLSTHWKRIFDDKRASIHEELALETKTAGSRLLQIVFCRYQARLDEAEHILAILQDITQERDHLKRIHQLAYHDPLTGLLNRTGFEANVDEHIRGGGSSFAMIVVDLHDFRSVNETLGYEAGNSILKRIAEGMTQQNPPCDYPARLGGDDFTFILKDLTLIETFRHFLTDTRRNFGTEHAELYLGASAGMSLYPDHGNTASDLLHNAEMAMMISRERGPNELTCYDTVIRDGVRKKVLLSNALENAIDRNELHLVFQPVVRSSDRELQGFEALLRWTSLRYGSVPPDVFIPIAEQKGLIHRIGQYVLEETCRFVKKMEAQNHPGYVSVNVSGVQLLREGFSVQFLQTLATCGISTAKIGVEVTETAVINNIDSAVVQLRHLQENGIRILLDDFGTGYSSLSYLGRLPVDILKIDKQFVLDGMVTERGKGLLATMIDLARNLDITVVAEGVETQAQFDTLCHLGCTMIQGYFIARPLMEKAALAWPEPL